MRSDELPDYYASMRPRLNAAENFQKRYDVVGINIASMRPRLNAAENIASCKTGAGTRLLQ